MIEIIAEISGNHGGHLNNAMKLINEAAHVGATGVKFQCFDPVRLAIARAGSERIQRLVGTEGQPVTTAARLRSLYDETHTPREWFPKLISAASIRGLTWHASAFDPEDVEFLETLDCPRYKIASFEATHGILIKRIKDTKKRIVVSVNQNEMMDKTTRWFNLDEPLTVLHATDYGVTSLESNLNRLRGGIFRMGVRWGLSDHTWDNNTSIIAAALGASMVEWHIRLPGVMTPDENFSLTPTEFGIRAVTVARVHDAICR